MDDDVEFKWFRFWDDCWKGFFIWENLMTHQQLFKKSDNDDGYISVICHRARYLDELKAIGFVESVDQLDQEPKKKPGRPPKVESDKAE